jgi:hypothetical protein
MTVEAAVASRGPRATSMTHYPIAEVNEEDKP